MDQCFLQSILLLARRRWLKRSVSHTSIFSLSSCHSIERFEDYRTFSLAIDYRLPLLSCVYGKAQFRVTCIQFPTFLGSQIQYSTAFLAILGFLIRPTQKEMKCFNSLDRFLCINSTFFCPVFLLAGFPFFAFFTFYAIVTTNSCVEFSSLSSLLIPSRCHSDLSSHH